MQLLRTYHVHKTTWPWASLKVHNSHMKVNVKLVRYFDVDNITINLQYDKAIYCVHRVPDATTIHLKLKGAERPFFMCEAQELIRFYQDGGPTLIVMKGHKPWIMYDRTELKVIHMRHICGTVQKSSLGMEDFSGARFCHLLGYQILLILQMLPKSKSYT